jgi:hypothetical protein
MGESGSRSRNSGIIAETEPKMAKQQAKAPVANPSCSALPAGGGGCCE